MNLKACITGSLMALLASSAMAQSLDPVRVQMFRSILKGNECTLTETAAANILPRFDFTRQETRAIVGALVAAGEVQLDGSTLMLVDGSCGTGDPVVDLLAQDNVQQFIAVMAENGCAMNEADAEPIFTARGINKAQVSAVIRPLMQNGIATFTNGVLRVDSAYCASPAVVAEAVEVVGSPVEAPEAMVELDRSGMFGMSRVRQLVDVMAANDCTLNMDVPDAFLAEAGIEHSFATFVARKMVSDGFASMADAQTMLLPAPYCVSANSPAPVVEAQAEQGVDMDMVASLREIFLANSCRLTEDQMDALLPPAGFNKDNIKPVFGYLEANGEMGDDGPDLVFYNDACAGAPAEVATASAETTAAEMDRSGMFGMSRVAALVDVMAQNGCTLNMEVADDYLGEAGIEHSFATFIARKMIADGFASMAGAENMVLSAPYCLAAAGAVVVAEVETPVETPIETPLEVPSEETGVDMAKVALIRQIFAENNCRLSEEMMGELLPAAGFSRADAGAVFNYLEAQGELADVDNDAILTGASCTATQAETPSMAGNDGTPKGIFISVAAQNGCALDVASVEEPLAVAGLRIDQAYRIVDDLIMDGKASLTNGGALVTLDPSICSGAAQPVEPEAQAETAISPEAASEPAQTTTVDSTAPRAGVLAMLAANGCEVTQANAAELVAAAGLDFNASMQILTQMMGSGEATSPDGGQTLQVGAPLCVATAAGAPQMTPREAFIDLIKQNNCSITAAEFSSLLPANGLDASMAFGMISELEAEGAITLPATRDVVTLSAEMCR